METPKKIDYFSTVTTTTEAQQLSEYYKLIHFTLDGTKYIIIPGDQHQTLSILKCRKLDGALPIFTWDDSAKGQKIIAHAIKLLKEKGND